jgi:hypothetical protein
VLLYPVILLILGVSLKNLQDYPSLLKPEHGHLKFHKPSYSTAPLRTPTLWSGVSILFLLCASAHSRTFAVCRAMKRRQSLPGSASAPDGEASSSGLGLGSGAGAGQRSGLQRLVQTHRWESATLLSACLTAGMMVPFGTIGYMSLLVIRPNVFEALPRDHAWFNVARALTLASVLLLLHENASYAKEAGRGALALLRKGVMALFGATAGGNTARRKRRNSGGHRRRESAHALAGAGDGSDSEQEHEPEEDGGDDEVEAGHGLGGAGLMSRVKLAEAMLAAGLIWGAVIALACTIRDLGEIAEIVGCFGAAILAFILPGPFSFPAHHLCTARADCASVTMTAVFHIVLFHLLKPRTIFLTTTSSPQIQSDVLLLNKERQLQRRLMGKRLGMDLGAFGVLLPLGIVGLARGIWAVTQG